MRLVTTRARRRRTRFVLVLAVLLVAAGTASGYFGALGLGAGTSSVAVAQAVVISPGATSPSTPLYPGGTGAVTGTITNPNGFAVRVARLSLDTARGSAGFALDAGHAGCNAAALSFAASMTTQTNGGAGWDVPPGGAVDFALDAAVRLDTTALDACQSAAVTVYLLGLTS